MLPIRRQKPHRILRELLTVTENWHNKRLVVRSKENSHIIGIADRRSTDSRPKEEVPYAYIQAEMWSWFMRAEPAGNLLSVVPEKAIQRLVSLCFKITRGALGAAAVQVAATTANLKVKS